MIPQLHNIITLIMDKLKSEELTINTEHSKKYHQAAFVYLLNALVYFFVATFRMPPHDFGIWNYLFYTLGVIFAVIFPYLIYKEYRIFTAILSVIYLIRTVVTLLAIPYYSILMFFMFVMHAFTCLMLTRAAWDIKIPAGIFSKTREEGKICRIKKKKLSGQRRR